MLNLCNIFYTYCNLSLQEGTLFVSVMSLLYFLYPLSLNSHVSWTTMLITTASRLKIDGLLWVFTKMCVKVLMATSQKTPSIINRTTLLSLNSFIVKSNKSELLKRTNNPNTANCWKLFEKMVAFILWIKKQKQIYVRVWCCTSPMHQKQFTFIYWGIEADLYTNSKFLYNSLKYNCVFLNRWRPPIFLSNNIKLYSIVQRT